MKFENLEGKNINILTNLEKQSSSSPLLDMSQLNEAIDNRVDDINAGEKLMSKEEAKEISTLNKEEDYEEIKMQDQAIGIPPIAPHPKFEPIAGTGLSKVTDIFGNTRICDPNSVDVFSGLPVTAPDNISNSSNSANSEIPSGSGAIDFKSRDQWKVDRTNQLVGIRDAAVERYKEAKSRGDVDEMLKWEAEANKQQGMIFNVLGISGYTLTPKAPGIS